eukprot:4199631-Heterocapsa_arctica.AAC.1
MLFKGDSILVIFGAGVMRGIREKVGTFEGLAVNSVKTVFRFEIIFGAVGCIPKLWPNCTFA